LKKNYFSSHKLPKQQSTIFWSQGILGVKLVNISDTKFSVALDVTKVHPKCNVTNSCLPMAKLLQGDKNPHKHSMISTAE
jgi:hypothetical protein